MSGFSNPIAAVRQLIRSALESANFVTGVSGWRISRDGSAEFQNLIARLTAILGTNPGRHILLDGNNGLIVVFDDSNLRRIQLGNSDPLAAGSLLLSSGDAIELDPAFLVANVLGAAGSRQIVLALNSPDGAGAQQSTLQLLSNSQDGTTFTEEIRAVASLITFHSVFGAAKIQMADVGSQIQLTDPASQLVIGGSGGGANLAILRPLTNDSVLTCRVTGDTVSRFLIDSSGKLSWGPGGAGSRDTTLARTGTGILNATSDLQVNGASLPRGIVGTPFDDGGNEAAARNPGENSDMFVTFTADATRLYVVYVKTGLSFGTAGINAMEIVEGGTVGNNDGTSVDRIMRWSAAEAAAGSLSSFIPNGAVLYKPTSGSKTVRLANESGSAGTIQTSGGATIRRQMWVEDIGAR